MSAVEQLDVMKPVGRQHVVLSHVSWEEYEECLKALDGDPTKVTYFEGEMEIMPPPIGYEHDDRKSAIRQLVDQMTLVRGIQRKSVGSPTLRNKAAKAGVEPDEGYYLGENAVKMTGVKRFNADRHPGPDLVIEVEVTSRVLNRLPVHAVLGVKEVWRHDGEKLEVLVLADGRYKRTSKSKLFPFLPMDEFLMFVERMENESQIAVLKEFGEWVKGL